MENPQNLKLPESIHPEPAIQTSPTTHSARIIVLTVILFLSLLFAGYFFMNQKYEKNPVEVTSSTVQTQVIPEVPKSGNPTPSAFPNRPQPEILGWKTYTDQVNQQFSFQYPEFMTEPSNSDGEVNPSRISSIYVWQIDPSSSGNFEHKVDLRILGPYPDTMGVDVVRWISEQGWPAKEGMIQESYGLEQITYKTVQGRKVVQSAFTEQNMQAPRSWTIYFNTEKGIYRIDLDLQMTKEELSKYQVIYKQLFSTLKFLK